MKGVSRSTEGLLEGVRSAVDDLTARMDALSRWKSHTNARLEALEDDRDRLEAENQQLRERVDELEAIAEQAMVVASRGHDPASRSKVEIAKHITRNELVRRAAMGGASSDRPVTIADVQEMGRPEHDLKWQTVADAWTSLQEEWPCFRETSKDGSRALTVSETDISKSLARAVELDLDRDDLTKSLVGDGRDGGTAR